MEGSEFVANNKHGNNPWQMHSDKWYLIKERHFGYCAGPLVVFSRLELFIFLLSPFEVTFTLKTDPKKGIFCIPHKQKAPK